MAALYELGEHQILFEHPDLYIKPAIKLQEISVNYDKYYQELIKYDPSVKNYIPYKIDVDLVMGNLSGFSLLNSIGRRLNVPTTYFYLIMTVVADLLSAFFTKNAMLVNEQRLAQRHEAERNCNVQNSGVVYLLGPVRFGDQL